MSLCLSQLPFDLLFHITTPHKFVGLTRNFLHSNCCWDCSLTHGLSCWMLLIDSAPDPGPSASGIEMASCTISIVHVESGFQKLFCSWPTDTERKAIITISTYSSSFNSIRVAYPKLYIVYSWNISDDIFVDVKALLLQLLADGNVEINIMETMTKQPYNTLMLRI